MQLPDLINGIFESGIGLLALLNVQALIRDKKLSGVHWGVTGWATLWSWWNLYYYPHLGQWLSFTGGLFIFLVNTTWLALLGYYTYVYGRRKEETSGSSTEGSVCPCQGD